MLNENMTAEQKYWYFRGYLASFIEQISMSMYLSEKEATKWVVNGLKEHLDFDLILKGTTEIRNK